jgi:hypothetical protein
MCFGFGKTVVLSGCFINFSFLVSGKRILEPVSYTLTGEFEVSGNNWCGF